MDTPEHINIVEDACAKFTGGQFLVQVESAVFTLGEISALAGDFYKSPEDFRRNAARARTFLNIHRKEIQGCREYSDTDAAGLTNGEYVRLSIANYSHFRPQPEHAMLPAADADRIGGLGDAIQEYKKFHEMARAYVEDRGLVADEDLDRALLYEGFALHFLVDLFASGHMRTPRAAITHYLDSRLGYPPLNAEIVGALLSLAQHDYDNELGLECEWDEWISIDARSNSNTVVMPHRQHGRLFGDKRMHLNDLHATATPHTLAMIISSITNIDISNNMLNLNRALSVRNLMFFDAPLLPPLQTTPFDDIFSDVRLTLLHQAARRWTPWYIQPSPLTFDDFLTRGLPRPAEAQKQDVPFMQIVPPNQSQPWGIRWNSGNPTVINLSTMRIDITIDSDGPANSISGVNIQITVPGRTVETLQRGICGYILTFADPKCIGAVATAVSDNGIQGDDNRLPALFEGIKKNRMIEGAGWSQCSEIEASEQ